MQNQKSEFKKDIKEFINFLLKHCEKSPSPAYQEDEPLFFKEISNSDSDKKLNMVSKEINKIFELLLRYDSNIRSQLNSNAITTTDELFNLKNEFFDMIEDFIPFFKDFVKNKLELYPFLPNHDVDNDKFDTFNKDFIIIQDKLKNIQSIADEIHNKL